MISEEEEEIYEVINIHKLKSATPNLRVVNMYGINFVDDSHVEAFSSNCIQVQTTFSRFIEPLTLNNLNFHYNQLVGMSGYQLLQQSDWRVF